MDTTLELGQSLLLMHTLRAPLAADPEEARWVACACTGDDAAYRWLMERYRFRAIRLAAHVLGRDADAEDIAQEAFIQAFRQLRTLRQGDRFGPWLFKIVIHRCLDHKRAKRWSHEMGIERAVAETSSESPDPLTKLLVKQLLDQMNPTMRAALVLRELEGLEYEEIAVVLKVPVGTVKSRLNAARTQFRNMWTRSEGENA